ncbi:DoxX family protein [Roseateles amylovorans]|uniref:DoxX family protein n=1 Tax=Roseateles amylovorans TaxID=2978473 RepID=A0ABY6B6P8_9BURK|nr:DoxX family protein [Roseateles amylovorans]UXH80507.1 DoxX family protein [Roseateles amylovorans]
MSSGAPSTTGLFTPVVRLATPARLGRWIALLLLCAAYLQGGLVKLFDFPGAVGEMQHFGLAPAPLFAAAVIVLELGASALILSGRWRWLGALALAAFTAAATFMANRYWDATGHERFMLMNSFFEHWGLVGGFLLVAWMDWREPRT